MSATDGPSKSTRPTWGADRKSYSEYLRWKLGDPLATLQTLFLPLRWFLAFSTFTYPQSLIIQANNEKVPLEDGDFPRVEDSDSAHVLSSRILQEWSLEQERIKAAQDAGKQPRTARRALLWVIVRVFGPEYALATLAALGETLVKILEALLLGSIIRWLTGGILDSSGYLWAGLLSLCAIWHGFLHHWLFYLSMRCGFRMRVGFISTIYRKALNLSITHTSSTGYITNLVSNDVQRFEDAGPFFFFILLGPLEAIISVGIAYTYIGVSSLVGFAILMLSIPLQSFFARQFGVLRRKTVKERDERIKTTSDALAGMMVIKLYAWEEAIKNRISSLRDAEMHWIRKASVLRAINEAMYVIAPSLTSLGTFGCFWALGGVFSADKIFVTLYLFSNIRLILVSFFAKGMQFASESSVSITRISEFLSLPEMTTGVHSCEADRARIQQVFGQAGNGEEIVVAVRDGAFSWEAVTGSSPAAVPVNGSAANEVELKPVSSGKTGDRTSSEGDSTAQVESEDSESLEKGGSFTLDNINLTLAKGTITAVVGPVGAGKSSLILALLSEMTRKQGDVLIGTDSIGYASQTPWIVNGTIEDNIIFGQPYDEKRFIETIELSAMTTDLEMFPNGRATMIGERGVTLSGGQRARTALARAIYADPDLYLLDDPLSAVDSRVAKHLWQTLSDLARTKGKTVLLVTHQLQFVKSADHVVIMEAGQITKQGSIAELDAARLPSSGNLEGRRQSFGHVLRQYSKKEQGLDVSVDEIADDAGEADAKGGDDTDDDKAAVGTVKVERAVDKVEPSGGEKADTNKDADKAKNAFVIEERQLGDLDREVFTSFFKATGGYYLVVIFFILMCVGEANLVLCDWFLGYWSRQTPAEQRNSMYIGVFAALTFSNIVIAVVRALMFFHMALTASTRMFYDMLSSILRAPLWFFQVNPLGRLLNRFSKDMALMDEMLPMVVYDFLQSTFMVIGIFILSAVIMPISLAFLPFLLTAFFFLRRYYVAASRQIKRLEANSRSPVYSAIPATLEGLPVIRAFRANPRFVTTFSGLQDKNTSQWFGFISTARWLGFRLDMGGALMLTFVVFLCIGIAPSLTGATVGLLLAYVLQMVGSLQWCVRQSVESENLFVSVERILDYTTRVPHEAAAINDVRPPKDWPAKGAVELKGMDLTYPVTGQTVIKGLSVNILAGEKIGLVGRTGAGKSSMLTALFRLVEPSPNGSIVIDGIATSDIGLQDLRSNLGIVPQEPTLFLGTLRFNIDPFNQYDDASIYNALEAVELKPKVGASPDKLDMLVSDGGSNWSVGERQLICLARAIMKRSRIIVLDEVGANIDVRTDKLIQQTLRSATGLFADATVITIAHRLGTVMDYDRILVLDKGTLVEFGRPHELLARGPTKGWLAKMVNDMGPEGEAQMKDIALKKEQERAAKETGKTQPQPELQAQSFGTRTRIVNQPAERARLNPDDANMFSIPFRSGYSLPPGIQSAGNEYADGGFEDEAHGAL